MCNYQKLNVSQIKTSIILAQNDAFYLVKRCAHARRTGRRLTSLEHRDTLKNVFSFFLPKLQNKFYFENVFLP